MDTQSLAIQALTKELPQNDFGLPTGIYRSDMLPFDQYKPPRGLLSGPILEELEEVEHLDPSEDPRLIPQVEVHRIAGFPSSDLHAAFMPLQYEEGFPAFDNGIPFWSRMEFEPVEAFQAFNTYLKMHQGSMGGRDEEEFDGHDASGARSLSALAAELFPTQQEAMLVKLTHWYHMYYWGPRAHAYDLYKVAEFRKRQEIRAIETQGSHYHEARRLRHRLQQYMESEEEFWELMTPKVAIDMFKTTTQLERISAGLPGAGPASEVEGGSRPMEVIFRNVANQGRKESSRVLTEEGEVLDDVLDNVEATEVLQELIIRGPSR